MVLNEDETAALAKLLMAAGVAVKKGHPLGYLGLIGEARGNVVRMQRSLGRYRLEARKRGERVSARPIPTGHMAQAGNSVVAANARLRERAIQSGYPVDDETEVTKAVAPQIIGKRGPGRVRRALRVLFGRA